MHIRMLIISQSEVCLHTVHSVHFQLSPFKMCSQTQWFTWQKMGKLDRLLYIEGWTFWPAQWSNKDDVRQWVVDILWWVAKLLVPSLYFTMRALFCLQSRHSLFHSVNHFQYPYANTESNGMKVSGLQDWPWLYLSTKIPPKYKSVYSLKPTASEKRSAKQLTYLCMQWHNERYCVRCHAMQARKDGHNEATI